MKYAGVLGIYITVEAESEDEAKMKMAESLCEKLKNGYTEFTVWEDARIEKIKRTEGKFGDCILDREDVRNAQRKRTKFYRDIMLKELPDGI